MKIAQLKRIGENFEFTTILDQESVESCPEIYGREYVRLTEWTDVMFVPRAAEDTAREQLDALDVAEGQLRRKFAEKLDQIASERAKLRALTHQPGEQS
jgi:hypothetical protein